MDTIFIYTSIKYLIKEIKRIIEDLKDQNLYLRDIYILSYDKHIRELEQTLNKINNNNFDFNDLLFIFSKYEFFIIDLKKEWIKEDLKQLREEINAYEPNEQRFKEHQSNRNTTPPQKRLI